MQIAWKTQSGVTFSNVSRPASRNTARISPWVKLSAGSLLLSPTAGRLPLAPLRAVSARGRRKSPATRRQQGRMRRILWGFSDSECG